MINITYKAQKYFYNLLKEQNKNTGIKIFVINPGTSYAECGVSYCSNKKISKSYLKLKYDKFNIYIEKKSKPYLKNSKIDLLINKYETKLTMIAPMAKKKLSNYSKNESLVNQIKKMLKLDINPMLMLHGGKVSLVKIDNKKYAILKFSGGCNGCSMINLTLKNSIEKKMLKIFPELSGVKDITEHNRGLHSYY
ncbi:NfuA family Fe-S biogenesis protein [Buchnera aphidicola (Taiwanaphis decaspermi)]|uniref:NfuA family Fe-S biogenesis protein n=1 Tax=Buchnera aphidicola TaxID=9 RepID=UPI0031B86FAE